MDTRLHDLLRTTKSDDTPKNSDAWTHMSMYSPHARWNIASSKLTEFWNGYCDIVYEGEGNYCIAEKPQGHMPIIADCTLKFYLLENTKDTLYDEGFLLAMVYCYQQAISDLLQISQSQIELICVILTSERNWIVDGNIVTQFRIQFPYCKTDLPTQIRMIRPRVIQLLRIYNVIARLPYQPVNDWEVIIDPIGPQEPVLLYRSTSQIDRPKMILEHIYGPITPDHIETKTGPMLELSQVFTPSNHHQIQQGLIRAEILEENHNFEYWLPLFLSVHYWEGITLPKNQQDLGSSNIKIISPQAVTPGSPILYESPMDICERLLPMLSQERVENDHYWIDVGKALYNCDSGGDLGLTSWIRFTERSDVHTEEECRELYYTFKDTHITLKTIAWYAREDSPQDYNKWHESWYKPAMEKATSCLHADVAQALYRVYWLEFVCASLDRNQWYHYKNHRWIKLDQGITLRQTISDNFLRRFENIRTDISAQIQGSNDDNFRQTGEIMIKKITALIGKLKTVSFKTNVMTEAREHFYDSKFNQVVDMDSDILGMLDCVIEVCGDKAYPRPGKPEDYISLCTGLPYLKDLHWDHDLVKRLMKWMGQVFVDEELRNYFLKMSASCLKGRNSDKVFPIWTGEGNNSKSMIVKLFEACFGGYCIKFPTSLITGKRTQSSAPMPEMARAKSTRVSFIQEPDDDEVIRGGTLKELTGGDSFFARMLHDNGGDVQAMFKLILMCNKIPPIPTGGQAVKNRTRILPFMSTWVPNPPESEAEQYAQRKFKMDPFFEKQIPTLAKAFIWVLVQYYPRYVSEGLREPEIVKEVTQEYFQNNDIYQQFIGECITVATNDNGERDMNASVTHTEIYREFKVWYKESFPGDKIPASGTVKTELIAKLGKQYRARWHGIRLVQHDNGSNLASI